MKPRLIILTLFILILPAPAAGRQAKIEGHVYNDKDRPVPSVRIVVVPGGQSRTTDHKGHFIIKLADNIQPGRAARIRVDLPKWVIFHPMFGECDTKSEVLNQEPLRVVIIPRGSPLNSTPKRLSEFVGELQKQVTRQKTTINALRGEVDAAERERAKYAFLREYAEEYGLALDKLKLSLDEWAQIKQSDDDLESARKEYWQGHFERVTELTGRAGPIYVEQLERDKKLRLEHGSKVIDTYTIEGNTFYEQFRFREALVSFNTIEQLFETRKLIKEDFAKEWADVKFSLGLVKTKLGLRVEAAEGRQLLLEALLAYREAETFDTREQSPYRWAQTRNNLGTVLRELGLRVELTESNNYLNRAEAAFRAALEVLTRERSPVDWAAAQNNLGTVLSVLGEQVEGPDSIKYLYDAKAAYQAALEVFTRAQYLKDWAGTQNNLCVMLLHLGEKLDGPDSIKYLKEAEAACRAVQEIRPRAQLPQDWATTQNNLGAVLNELGERLGGADSIKYLKEAEATYQATLEVFTRTQVPQEWAKTQVNLGRVWGELGERTEGAERVEYLKKAEAALRAALEVRTRAHLPQQWAITQTELGIILGGLGQQLEGEEKIKYLNAATAAFRAALEVRTREQYPGDWGRVQHNLAVTYTSLEDWQRAGDAYVNVLQIYPDDKDAYFRATVYYHEFLFDFDRAFALQQRWLERRKDDVLARVKFAEAHFTTARFPECGQHVNALLADPVIPADLKMALRAIEIANLLALGEANHVPAKLNALIEEVSRQPAALKVRWVFNGTRHFIDHSEKLSPHRTWLGQLLNAFDGKDRDKMLKALRDMQVEFKDVKK